MQQVRLNKHKNVLEMINFGHFHDSYKVQK